MNKHVTPKTDKQTRQEARKTRQTYEQSFDSSHLDEATGTVSKRAKPTEGTAQNRCLMQKKKRSQLHLRLDAEASYFAYQINTILGRQSSRPRARGKQTKTCPQDRPPSRETSLEGDLPRGSAPVQDFASESTGHAMALGARVNN